MKNSIDKVTVLRDVCFNGAPYKLISFVRNGVRLWGTLPADRFSSGKLDKPFPYVEAHVSDRGEESAIEVRVEHILLDAYRAAGHSRAESIMYLLHGCSEEGWEPEVLAALEHAQ